MILLYVAVTPEFFSKFVSFKDSVVFKTQIFRDRITENFYLHLTNYPFIMGISMIRGHSSQIAKFTSDK